MDPNTRALMMGAAAAGGSAEKIYVEDVFSTWLYGADTNVITNTIDLAGKGGLVWIKRRSGTTGHRLTDTARGVTKSLASETTAAEVTETTGLTNFTSTGFEIGSDSDYYAAGHAFASWTFRKQAKFFDVVTYTGTGANRTIVHSLGSVPGTIIVKRTDTTGDWQVYHRSLANTEYLVLNTTAAKATGTTRWNSTTPTSTEFSLGTDATVNASSGTYVAYLFAHDAGGFGDSGNDGIIKCGDVTTGSSGVTDVTLGWEPQWVLIRNTDGGAWHVFDNMRGFLADTTSSSAYLAANSSAAEASTQCSLSSTGFRLSSTDWGGFTTLVYIAIRRGPMKTPLDATKVFSANLYTGTNTDNREVYTGIVTDMVWARRRNDTGVDGMVVGDRLRGQPYLLTGASSAEVNDADAFDRQIVSTTEYGTAWSSMTGFFVGNDVTAQLNANTTSNNHVALAFRKAPGFFDIVTWTASATTSISHNLGVIPELIIAKSRNDSAEWWSVYTQAGGRNNVLYLNTANDQIPSTNYWGTSGPTSTTFDVQSLGNTNNIGNMIAYLFATCPGVSKVGSYTGTGTTLSVDCGFTNGARFVLIKCTDSTGDWYVWDTARGIVSGNDPYLLLNSNAPEVTNTDYIDPLSSGFQISSTAPAAINANGGTYIYLAIA